MHCHCNAGCNQQLLPSANFPNVIKKHNRNLNLNQIPLSSLILKIDGNASHTSCVQRLIKRKSVSKWDEFIFQDWILQSRWIWIKYTKVCGWFMWCYWMSHFDHELRHSLALNLSIEMQNAMKKCHLIVMVILFWICIWGLGDVL